MSKQLISRSLLPLEKFKNFREITHSATLRRSCHFYHIAIIIVPFLAHVNSTIYICQKLCHTKNTEKETRLINYLTYLPVFDKLTKSQQDTLTSSSFVRKFGKGDLLHNGSQNCTGLLLVLSGQIRAFTVSDDGKEITMYRLFERDICLFSASCIMNSIQFDITVTAEKETEVLVIPSEVYKSIMDVSAPLANYTNEVMASRFSDVMWLIDQVMWKSFDKRLADFLLNEASIEGTNILKITHETIGNHLGNPREVVTRMLKYFVREGFISLSRGTIEIIDKDGLEKIIV